MTSWPDRRLWDDTDPCDRWDEDDAAADRAHDMAVDRELGLS